MPKEFSVALRRDDTDEYGSAASPVLQKLGLLEFLNKRPLYAAEMFTLFKYCRITAVDLRYEIWNKGTNAIDVAIGIVSNADFATLSFAQLAEKAGSTRKMISPSGGMDRIVIQKRFSTEDWVGNPNFSKYWFDQAQSVSTTPLDAEEPVIAIAVAYAGGSTTVSAVPNWRLTFHCQFFDLETPALS
jgi:hypothetical protein